MAERFFQGNVDCPVDFVSVNENQVRLTALQVFLFSVIYISTGFWPVFAILIPDFILRASALGKFSLLTNSSKLLVKTFHIGNKPVDRAPKRFAASIGAFFSVAITVAHLSGYIKTAYALAAVILLFSFLESFVGFCAGCYVYAFLKKFQRN